MIVVDGQIFEAFFDEGSQNMRVKARKRVRCHWRGARSWRLHATIDVVSLDHLDNFLKTRAQESITLVQKLEIRRNQVAKCFEEKSIDSLGMKSVRSDIDRIPALLREVVQQDQGAPNDPG